MMSLLQNFDFLVYASYVILVIATMIVILLENRQPVKTMAWLMVLWFIPFIGIIFYFFFGRNTRKERMISERSLNQLTRRSMWEYVEQRDLHIPENKLPLVRLLSNRNYEMPFKDNDVEIFTSGYEFFPALLHTLSQAREHIHIESYIFDDDPLGRLIADALIAKARQGVEVRIIYDDVGCWSVKNAFFDRMRDAGIDVNNFLPVRFPAFTGKVNYRDHRKICVVDGKWGFIGGMNIARRYVQGTKRQGWRDTHLRVRGAGVYALQRTFLIDWYFVDRTLITDKKYYPPIDQKISNNCLMQVVTSGPVTPDPDIMQGYVRILLEAKRYVYMESPYFLPTEPVLFAMRAAALAGVDVRLIIPRHSDAKLVQWASQSYVREVLDGKVKVYLYEGAFNHSKILVSDDFISTVGSTNIDFRSFENNFEANAFFFDEAMALRLKHVFEEDERHSMLFTEEKAMQPNFWKRLGESIIRLLSPLL
ncbi:MAG: cardiolipin synthase [Prevotella sp.]|uniref:cardiolipin synthase n=1 Tax=Prevotella sp. AGR2160 TaxID=1280674 RepID=UPI001E46D77F|nr:cardiolipin synthase [Prevotella sp. AGR2160]MDD5862345.1 cardiolipin synthase [Prevotella sp.]